MRDESAHFLITVAEACESARLAHLPVEVTTRDGRRFEGVPHPQEAPPGGDGELDDTGYKNGLRLGDDIISLEHVVELRLRHPSP